MCVWFIMQVRSVCVCISAIACLNYVCVRVCTVHRCQTYDQLDKGYFMLYSYYLPQEIKYNVIIVAISNKKTHTKKIIVNFIK